MSRVRGVATWRQRGKFYFWRFTENERNFPGWHFMVDRAAATSIAALVNAMIARGSACTRTVEVSAPTKLVLSVPNNRGGNAGWEAPYKLSLKFVSADPTAWSIEGGVSAVEWHLGVQHAPAVANAFADPMKCFDTAIGPGPSLWSWGLSNQAPLKPASKRKRKG